MMIGLLGFVGIDCVRVVRLTQGFARFAGSTRFAWSAWFAWSASSAFSPAKPQREAKPQKRRRKRGAAKEEAQKENGCKRVLFDTRNQSFPTSLFRYYLPSAIEQMVFTQQQLEAMQQEANGRKVEQSPRKPNTIIHRQPFYQYNHPSATSISNHTRCPGIRVVRRCLSRNDKEKQCKERILSAFFIIHVDGHINFRKKAVRQKSKLAKLKKFYPFPAQQWDNQL